MLPCPPRSTRTYTLFPYSALFRSRRDPLRRAWCLPRPPKGSRQRKGVPGTGARRQADRMRNATIVAPQPEAVEAGAAVLERGGNAVDAALACPFVQEIGRASCRERVCQYV